VYEEQTHLDASKDPFSKPSPFLDRLAVGVRALEEWYAADFERRITELSGLLRTQITEELRSQFTTELNSSSERIRKQYEERAYAQLKQWESERQVLKREIEDLQSRLPTNDVLNEIAVTETALGKSLDESGVEIPRGISSAAALGQLLQTRAQQLELQAYLRGMKFALARESAPSRPIETPYSENRPVMNPSPTAY
jgi:hypothetical protein